MLASQRYRMTLQLLDAEQLRAQQLGIPVVTRGVSCERRKSELLDDYDILLVRIQRSQRNTAPIPSFS
ncbi:MAG: hypothetical protein ACYC3N_01925 [Halothiobacillus sp.]